jgi:hypothetical protein
MAARRHTREDSGIRLDREGRWWHDGEPVEHPRIIEAFNRGLTPTGDGRFRLVFGADWCFVTVEGPAYRVTGLTRQTDASPLLELSDGTQEPLDPASLDPDGEGVFTCGVKGGRAQARFSRDAQAALGELLEESEGKLWLRCGAYRSRVGPLGVETLPIGGKR